MKKAPYLILFICSFLLHSCADNKAKEETVLQEQTPEILDNSKSEISSLSKRYDSDIVQELFNEAMSKDSKLKNLSERMNEIGRLKSDSLQPFRKYFQNNELYWTNAYKYINQVSDSAMKHNLKIVFKEMEAKYKNSVSNPRDIISNLEKRESILNDCEILMKLSVSASMISNYQKNELPGLNGLNRMIESYDTLINETKEYSKIVK
jgi:leucyl aminopeptidase (aminopeptidase T)